MSRQWFAARNSLLVTTVSGALIAALIAAVAVVSSGYTAQDLELNDASVWVASSERQAVGRANTEVFELNSVLRGDGSDLDVLQSGSTVLVIDRSNSRLDIVNPSTSAVDETVPLPPNQPDVLLAGQSVVILSKGTGELWVLPLSELANFDVANPPTLTLGDDAVASLDADGVLFALSPGAGQLYRLATATPAGSSGAVEETFDVELSDSGTFLLTSVAGEWVILDTRAQQLHFDGFTLAIDDSAVGPRPVLQMPSTTGDAVFIAGAEGMIAVALDGTTVTPVVTGRSGSAARPIVAHACTFAAWTDGQSWRQCGGDEEGVFTPLSGLSGAALLAFRENGKRLLLNDSRSGAAWAVTQSGQRIDNWEELIPPEDEDREQEQNDENVAPEVDKIQLPPVAIDDEFGARPGKSTILPVLLNDYDPNGDVLVVSEVTGVREDLRVDLINDRQQLLLTMPAGVTGVLSFQYTISDGRGGTASATVDVTVRGEDENGPPRQVRSTRAVVGLDGRVTTQVLGDWVDPDGDAFYLVEASAPAPDTVSFKPQGGVVFVDSGSGTGMKSVPLVVSDGRASGSGSLTVEVVPRGQVPIVADPFVVLATAGQEVRVAPLDHVRGGSAPIRLLSVPAKVGVKLTPSYESGTFRFESDQVTTHYLEYIVTDGDQTVTAFVRVDVVAPPDANARPITVPKTVFVRTLRAERIDVTASDIDPSGGVLVVTGILNLASTSGVSAEVLEQRLVRLRLDEPLDGPVTFNYRVSNGLAEADGEITVVEIPNLTRLQPPIATDDKVTARVGAVIDIPVLANDEHPDGEELTLSPVLAENVPDDAGLLFASGRVLRYLAPDLPGNYTAVYEVTGPDGQGTRAQVRIAVRERDLDSNNPPVAATVVARALAGETVNIRIPLQGIDPDGDSVRLLRQETSPERGSVIDVGSDTISYRAGDYSAGTDVFTYSVIDALGAVSTGTVRIGISPRLDGARNPVAILDEVVARPGTTVAVQVLANDADPDGSPLTVVSAQPNDAETLAVIQDDLVLVTPPSEPGRYGVVYRIENTLGGSSSNFITVTVDPDAPLSYPIASDSVLTLTDVLEREFVDVDVLSRVFFADGDPATLGLSIQPGYGATAQVLSDKRMRVRVETQSQIIPFRVTHPEDETIFGFAFVWVPGTDDALPQINRNAAPLRVVSEQPLFIDLNDYVVAVSGEVRLTDRSLVRATHANGAELVASDDRLVFTSADRYFGPASISFEVTDGTSALDPDGRKSVIVLPIEVLPRENQPPVFGGAVMEFEPAQEREIDLVRLTSYPYLDDIDELAFTVLNPLPEGFSYTLTGQSLFLRANPDAVKGTVTSMTIGVRDDLSVGQAGRIQLTVVPSSRPLAQPGADNAIAKRGETTVVDVLANDYATNPFPGQPLRVVAIRGIDGGSLPTGVQIAPSADRSTLAVTVSTAAEPIDTNLQYQVADATGDPDRYVWGTVRISVQDRPSPVSDVRITEFADRRLTVNWNTGAFNNSPIIGYKAIMSSVASGAVLSTTDCGGSLCQVTTPGNGPDNAVRIAITAENAMGVSDPVSNSGPIWSDIIPAPPTNLAATPLNNGLRITWRKPVDTGGGTAITRYVVTLEGAATEEFNVPVDDPEGTLYARSITNPAIQNGSSITYTVSARNRAVSSLAQWNSAAGTGTPAGPPIRVAAPLASANQDDGGSATLSWAGAFSTNGRSITEYYAAIFTGAPPTCGVTGEILPGTPVVPPASSSFQHVGTATAASFSSLTPNTTYSLVVFAFNGMGCTSSVIVEATPRSRPGKVVSISSSGPHPNGSFAWDYRLDGFTMEAGSDADSFRYRLSGGSVDGGEYGPRAVGSLLETSNNSQYGENVSVAVKACRQYPEITLCSADWSEAFPLGVPVRNSELGGLVFTHEPFGTPVDPLAKGLYSWSSSPTGNYESVTFSCAAISEPLMDGGEGSCEVTENGPPNRRSFPPLIVTITANGVQYSRTYVWSDYD